MKSVIDHSRKTLVWLLVLVSAWVVNGAAASDVPTIEQVLNRLGVPNAQLHDLDQGKAISWKYPENTEKELAEGLAVYVHAPLANVIGYVQQGELAGLDSSISAQGTISRNPGVEAFKHFSLGGNEAQKLLEAEPGEEFNLSQEEIVDFARLRESLASAEHHSVAQTVSQHYREMLLRRYRAYRKRGLAGIAPYARGSQEQADPAAELRTATARGDQTLKSFSPELHRAWLDYPKAMPANVAERFSWENRVVDNRPTATLTHRLIHASDVGAVIFQRQFYVGHSYNASQLIVGCLPYREGAIIFYALRSSTDQVTGLGSGLKHAIGRHRMECEMLKQLQRLQSILK